MRLVALLLAVALVGLAKGQAGPPGPPGPPPPLPLPEEIPTTTTEGKLLKCNLQQI